MRVSVSKLRNANKSANDVKRRKDRRRQLNVMLFAKKSMRSSLKQVKLKLLLLNKMSSKSTVSETKVSKPLVLLVVCLVRLSLSSLSWRRTSTDS